MFLCSRLKQLLAYISLSPLVRPISPPKNGMWGLPCHSAFLNNKLGHRWPSRAASSEFLPQSALSLCAVVVGRGRNTNRQAHKHKYTNTNTNTQSALSLCAVAAGGRNTNRQADILGSWVVYCLAQEAHLQGETGKTISILATKCALSLSVQQEKGEIGKLQTDEHSSTATVRLSSNVAFSQSSLCREKQAKTS